jgi:acetyltransferase
LPPLNLRLAHELIAQTRIFRQLQGYRDHPRAAIEEIALTLVKLSQLICDLDEVVEIDLNPLLADAERVLAVDARVRLERPGVLHGNRLAIRAYPKELEREEHLSSIGNLKLRPIRPEDAPPLAELIADLGPEDARFRFFTPVRSFDPSALARFTQIDYDREMAFVAFADVQPDRLLAVVRLAADPDNVRAEFALVVRSDMHRRGLGRLLLAHLIEYARSRGISELFGDVLAENRPMLALCSQLGFITSATESSDVLRATLAPQLAPR